KGRRESGFVGAEVERAHRAELGRVENLSTGDGLGQAVTPCRASRDRAILPAAAGDGAAQAGPDSAGCSDRSGVVTGARSTDEMKARPLTLARLARWLLVITVPVAALGMGGALVLRVLNSE